MPRTKNSKNRPKYCYVKICDLLEKFGPNTEIRVDPIYVKLWEVEEVSPSPLKFIEKIEKPEIKNPNPPKSSNKIPITFIDFQKEKE